MLTVVTLIIGESNISAALIYWEAFNCESFGFSLLFSRWTSFVVSFLTTLLLSIPAVSAVILTYFPLTIPVSDFLLCFSVLVDYLISGCFLYDNLVGYFGEKSLVFVIFGLSGLEIYKRGIKFSWTLLLSQELFNDLNESPIIKNLLLIFFCLLSSNVVPSDCRSS